ncbi:MAG: bifunctional phosphoribosyl-AMP cyclohydrolase/phosphoribosyl-ATP diphosphatase HisIE [Blastocatellia bacterium]|nr:bifunctional phosphoribosyl-AMP cyclohydrolase/phosphoribosyl-ATP diphosphatase HisIE [Blastocatellia bacterium]
MNINEIDFAKYTDGLVPAVVQDAATRRVLMVGFMDRPAVERTIESGRVTFYSRSRQQLWTKGETSGNYLTLKDIRLDCDADTLLVHATPTGPVCHTGADTCFSKEQDAGDFLRQLESVIADRRRNPPPGSYTATLFAAGVNKIAQKVGEEAVEVVIASMGTDRDALKGEAADLLYHLMVLFAEKEITLDEVLATLQTRAGLTPPASSA